MKLITILFLCSRLLPCLTEESITQEIDCNDEDVFYAVDAALNNYNHRNESSNQFVLYRVFEVNKTVGPETLYSFKYQVKEGDCPVQSGKSWQDCDYKGTKDAATGKCTATVEKRGSLSFSVASQDCQITPGSPAEVSKQTKHFPCIGCMQPLSTKSSDLQPVLTHAIQHLNNKVDHSHLFALGEVKKAQSQVVAGTNYEITYSVVQTNCSKEKFLSLTPECKSLLNGDMGECTDHISVDLQDKIVAFSQDCEIYLGEDLEQPPARNCPGCPSEIPVNSPDLKEALTHSITKLNAQNNGAFHFKIDTVTRATSQVVAGIKYSIDFIARETSCSKESHEQLIESCQPKQPGQILNCNAKVYMRPWENYVHSTVNCQKATKMMLMRRPPGFSPFRSIQVVRSREGTTKLLPSCEYKGRPPKAEAQAEAEAETEAAAKTKSF